VKPLNLPPMGTEVLVISENPYTNKTSYVVATRCEGYAKDITHKGSTVSVTSYFVESNGIGDYVWDATHWMPLPETYSDNVESIRKLG